LKLLRHVERGKGWKVTRKDTPLMTEWARLGKRDCKKVILERGEVHTVRRKIGKQPKGMNGGRKNDCR